MLPASDGQVEWEGGGTTLLTIVERHGRSHTAAVPLLGFELGVGAVATTYSHDSHNLTTIGTSRAAMALAANTVLSAGGGIAVVIGERVAAFLPLLAGGLMSDRPVAEVVAGAKRCGALHEWGYRHANAFMSVSTLSLPGQPVAQADRSRPRGRGPPGLGARPSLALLIGVTGAAGSDGGGQPRRRSGQRRPRSDARHRTARPPGRRSCPAASSSLGRACTAPRLEARASAGCRPARRRSRHPASARRACQRATRRHQILRVWRVEGSEHERHLDHVARAELAVPARRPPGEEVGIRPRGMGAMQARPAASTALGSGGRS